MSKSCSGCKHLSVYSSGKFFCGNAQKAYDSGVEFFGDSPGLFRINKLTDVHCSVYEK